MEGKAVLLTKGEVSTQERGAHGTTAILWSKLTGSEPQKFNRIAKAEAISPF